MRRQTKQNSFLNFKSTALKQKLWIQTSSFDGGGFLVFVRSPPNNHDTFVGHWCLTLRLSYFNPTRKNKVSHTSVSLCWTVPWFGSQNIVEVVETSGKVKRVTNLNNKGSNNKNPFKQTGSVYTVKFFPLETRLGLTHSADPHETPKQHQLPFDTQHCPQKGEGDGRKKGHSNINMTDHVRQKHHLLQNMTVYESETPVFRERESAFRFHTESRRSIK